MRWNSILGMAAVGLTLLVAGCGSPPIDMPVAKPVTESTSLGVDYTFSLWVGEFQSNRYAQMGREFGHLVFVVDDVLPDIWGKSTIVRLWVKNHGKQPLSLTDSQFELVSPDGAHYSTSWDDTWDAAIVHSDKEAMVAPRTLQPNESDYLRLYFRVGNSKIASGAWRLGYRPSLLSDTRYVWAHIAYRTELVPPQ